MTTPICPYCGAQAEKTSGRDWYPDRKDLWHLRLWGCQFCDAYVGCHGNTWEPKGTLANLQLRRLRSKCHAVFDPRWKPTTGKINREIASAKRQKEYAWLANQLGISVQECHFGMFNVDMCRKVLKLFGCDK
jgi:hypothetical protein